MNTTKTDKETNIVALQELYTHLNKKKLGDSKGAEVLKEIKGIENKISRLIRQNISTPSKKLEIQTGQAEVSGRNRVKKLLTGVKNLILEKKPDGAKFIIESETEGAFEYLDLGLRRRDDGSFLLIFS